MNNNNISSFIVRFTDGSINHEETLSQFVGELHAYEAEVEIETKGIALAVNALFDQHRGARLNAPFLVGETLRRLNVQPETYTSLTLKVQEFLRSSPSFDVSKGKGGGWARTADLRR